MIHNSIWLVTFHSLAIERSVQNFACRAFVLPNPMVCFTPMLKVSQSEAWSIPFSITGFFKEVSITGLPCSNATGPVVSATKVAKLVDPAALQLGFTRRQVASMEAGQEDTLLGDPSMETHLASERLERYYLRIEKVSSSRSIYKALCVLCRSL